MSKSSDRLTALALIVGGLVAPAALADSVQGVVKTEFGDPVQSVTVALTGAVAGAQPDVFTDALGAYNASVPADTYTMTFTPPPASGLVPQRVTGIVVAGGTQLGDRVLRLGVDVTGLVTDPLAAPVAGVDLRFADLVTGKTIYTPSDDTDAAGEFAVFVPPGSYKVEFRPPVLVDLAPVELRPVTITAAGALPTVVLPEGVVVIGTVRDEPGEPVADVDLDFIDATTGNKIFTTRDDTNAFGVFRTVVVPGVYDMRYLPPPASGLVAKEIPGVQLLADVTLPDVTLLTGVRFSGRVVDSMGVGLTGVDLNVFDNFSGEKLLTPGDDTDATGNYLLSLAPGTYDVRYTPPAGPPYLPQRIDGIVVAADVVRPDVVLELGFLVSGSTVDGALQPVAEVDLDFKDQQTGDLIYVVRDDSDLLGEFAIAVPGATYRIDFDPPAESNLLPLSLDGVRVDQDIDLGQVVLPAPALLSGVVQDAAGTPLAGVRFEVRDASTGEPLVLPNELTDATGYFGATVPPGAYRVYFEPAAGTSFFPRLTDAVQVNADIDLGVIVLTAGFVVTGVVVNPDGAAIAGVTVRAEELSGPGASTFDTHTDAGGGFAMLVAPGTYEVVYDPVGLPFLRRVIGPISIDADTTLPRAVLDPGWSVSGRVLDDTSAGVAGVDVDLIDAASGSSIPLQGDLSDADGSFSVKVGVGTYRLRLQPDTDSGFFEAETSAFAVSADVDLGDLFLPRGVTVDGSVVDSLGAPIAGVEVDFIPEPTNSNPDSFTALTDEAGLFIGLIPQGDYRVRYAPPAGSAFFGLEVGPLQLLLDTSLGSMVLNAGFRVSGRVFDPQQIAAPGVDVDLLEAATGQSIPLQDDLTDLTGGFAILVSPGDYFVRLEPDPTTRLLPLQMGPVLVAADVDLGNLTLAIGVLLSGEVIDSAAAGIPRVGIDVVDAVSGLDALLVGDRTDALGTFVTAITPGDYFVEYRPPLSTAYVARRIGPVAVPGDTQLPTVTLDAGTLVSGVVLDPGLAPLAGVDTEWRAAGTCDLVFTVRDSTDDTGRFEVALLPGSYDLTLIPPPASGLFAERIPTVEVAGDAVELPSHTLSPAVVEIETCNQLDDDCDGVVDEGCPAAAVLVVEPTTLSWGAVAEASDYDVVRGDLFLMRTSGMAASVSSCLANDTTVTSLANADEPLPGQGFWVLVRWNPSTGVGSYGDSRRDQDIGASGQDCPP